MVGRINSDSLELIKSGDIVELDANQGTITGDPDPREYREG
jgi:hypothetical protein